MKKLLAACAALIVLCLLSCDIVLLCETAMIMPEGCLVSIFLLDPLSMRMAPIQCAAMHTHSFTHLFVPSFNIALPQGQMQY